MSRTNKLALSSLLVAISVVLSSYLSIMVPLMGFPSLKFSITSIPLVINGILFGPLFAIIGGLVSDVLSYVLNPQGSFYFGFTLNAILWGFIPSLMYIFIRKNPKFNFKVLSMVTYGVLYVYAVYYTLTVDKIVENKIEFIVTDPIRYTVLALLTVIIVITVLFITKFNTMGTTDESNVYRMDQILFVYTIPSLLISLLLTPLWLNQMFGMPMFLSTIIRVFKQAIELPIQALIIYVLLNALQPLLKKYSL